MTTPGKTKKTYVAPFFRRVDANTAKAALESKAVPGDPGTGAMLDSIRNSKTRPRGFDSKVVENPSHKP